MESFLQLRHFNDFFKYSAKRFLSICNGTCVGYIHWDLYSDWFKRLLQPKPAEEAHEISEDLAELEKKEKELEALRQQVQARIDAEESTDDKANK